MCRWNLVTVNRVANEILLNVVGRDTEWGLRFAKTLALFPDRGR